MKWTLMSKLMGTVILATACNYHFNAFDPQLQPPANKAGKDVFPDLAEAEDGAARELSPAEGDAWAEVTLEVVEAVPGCTDEEALNYDPGATEDDGSCLFNVTITFKLDMSCADDATAPQVAGGNTFGMPGDHPMADPDGDNIWEVAITLPPALSTGYTYTSDACQDWSCKEDISGQDCATDPYSDRLLNTGTQDHEIKACFGQCGDGFCGACEGAGR